MAEAVSGPAPKGEAHSREGQLRRLRERVRQMSDDELLTSTPADARRGPWGTSGALAIDGTRLFLKRVPLTDIEAERPYSTRNHFGLPIYYSYGVGSAGFGVWRELAMHEITGDLPGFPALLDHRVMPRTLTFEPLPWSDEEYVRYWNGSAAVARFMRARYAASQEVWMVLEHVPHPMVAWLVTNQDRVHEVLAQLFETIATLRSLGAVHFDAHLGNVVTDGHHCRLTDFGLGMASAFELGDLERKFLARHHHYDYGTVLGYLGLMLAFALGEEPTVRTLRSRIDQLEHLPVVYHAELVATLKQYREPILYMVDFLQRVQRPSKRGGYDDRELARLLRSAHAPIDAS